jgi:predicted DNA-binding transcriptional regulator AlpA
MPAHPYDRDREGVLAKIPTSPDAMLSPRQVCALLGISSATFQRLARQQLPFVLVSNRRLAVRRADFEAWRAKRTLPVAQA